MTLDPTRTTHLSAKEKEAAASGGSPEAVVIDLGKKNRKQVRKLRRGKPGRLMNRIEEAMGHLEESGALAGDVQPIVVIVKERSRRGGKRIAKMWGLG